jgi:hypothetical protein
MQIRETLEQQRNESVIRVVLFAKVSIARNCLAPHMLSALDGVS